MKKKGTNDPETSMFSEVSPVGSGSAGSASGPTLTPLDIQNKEFRVARLGGYRMREVDEFLDEVTEAMGSLIAENERLRADRADEGHAAMERPSAGTSSGAGPVDAAGVQAFLRKEKDFLRSLGSLVQGHAEEMKGMARAARSGSTGVERTAEPARGEARAEDEGPPVPVPDAAVTAAIPRDGSETEQGEPIDVSEPQPAASRKTEDRRPEGSLRDLFWGEDA